MNLKGRDFLKLLDYTKEEIEYLLELSADFKAKKKAGIPHKICEGKNVALGSVFTNAFNGKYYLRRVGGYAWMMLFTALWSMLFVIPGIIKGLSYSLTPYILAKYPEVPSKDALKLSMRFMNGRKGELFVLGLSFIGWCILAGLTFGILGIFYVIPYMSITVTLWQKQVMDSAIARGEFIYHPITNA